MLGHDPLPLDILVLSEQALGRASPERSAFLIWARAKATGGDFGGSVRPYCSETGTKRSTFERRRKVAYTRIAVELNRIADQAIAALEALRRDAAVIASKVDRL